MSEKPITITELFERSFKYLELAEKTLAALQLAPGSPNEANREKVDALIEDADKALGEIRTRLAGCWLDPESDEEDMENAWRRFMWAKPLLSLLVHGDREYDAESGSWVWSQPAQTGRIIPSTCKTTITVGRAPGGLAPGARQAEVVVETTSMDPEEVDAANKSARDVAEDLIAAMWRPGAVVAPEQKG